MSDKPSKFVSRAGFGRQGYCRLCSFQDLRQLNDKIKAGWNARQVKDWLVANYGVTFSRQTFYTHKDEHMTRPEDKIVSAVEKAQRKDLMLPRVSSNEQYLEAIRDLGYARAVANPDEVTIQDGLKAAQILVSQKARGGDTFVLLAKVFTGGDFAPSEVIDGEAHEVA